MEDGGNSHGLDQGTGHGDMNPILIAAVVVVILAAAAIFLNASPQQETGLMVLEDDLGGGETPAPQEEQQPKETQQVTPTSFAVRQRYFEEAFRPKREEYRLFEKASEFLDVPIEQVPNYFSLNSEQEIFQQLPEVPDDFSEVAFLLASGKSYAIGRLSEEYFLQPEFYPGFKESGLRYWTEPNPSYWSTNGYGAYPGDQEDTLSHSGRNEFTAVVFFYSGYGVQTYQGTTIVPSSDALEHFDIEITPNTFLLTPTFPKFSSDWVHQIVIRGKLKEGTPPGKYNVGFKIVEPPKEKREEWAFKYRNLYFDAANSIAPSRFPFQFIIHAEE